MRKGMMNKDLAEKSGIAPSVISKIERRRGRGSLGTLRSLAAALGCTIDDLLEDAHGES